MERTGSPGAAELCSRRDGWIRMEMVALGFGTTILQFMFFSSFVVTVAAARLVLQA